MKITLQTRKFLNKEWLISPQNIQPRTTLLVDLSGGEFEVLGRMKRNYRYNIRLAKKNRYQSPDLQ